MAVPAANVCCAASSHAAYLSVAALSTTGGIVAFLGSAKFVVSTAGATLDHWKRHRHVAFWTAYVVLAAGWCAVTTFLLLEVIHSAEQFDNDSWWWVPVLLVSLCWAAPAVTGFSLWVAKTCVEHGHCRRLAGATALASTARDATTHDGMGLGPVDTVDLKRPLVGPGATRTSSR